MQALASGMTIRGRYRIVRKIGQGGMGAVYEAYDCTLQNAVAVKQMTVDGAEADAAFEREAKLLARLRHAGLPVVIDYFVEDGCHYLVMQYIEGQDLWRVVRDGGPLSSSDLARVALPVLDALVYLHGYSPAILHRDIKPENLKRTPDGQIVLLDFGLARWRPDGDVTVTAQERSLFGFSLNYSPPEQMEGRPTDARSDLYALGATMFFLASGVPPPNAMERINAIRLGEPDPLVLAMVPHFDDAESLRATVLRAMALDSGERFPSAVDMHAVLSGLSASPSPDRLAAEPTAMRRVDAALPSQAQVGRQTDLLVQVRFLDSPVLGLEEWPTRRRPPQIEQASDSIRLTFPVDSRSGRALPARLHVRVVTSDFSIDGRAEHVLDVPPEEYSKRVLFLVTPRHNGPCRLNVEVLGVDALYLGAIGVEADAVDGQTADVPRAVANLVLTVVAEKRASKDLVVQGGDRSSRAAADSIEELLLQMRAHATGEPPHGRQAGAAFADAAVLDSSPKAKTRAVRPGYIRAAMMASPALILILGVSIWRGTMYEPTPGVVASEPRSSAAVSSSPVPPRVTVPAVGRPPVAPAPVSPPPSTGSPRAVNAPSVQIPPAMPSPPVPESVPTPSVPAASASGVVAAITPEAHARQELAELVDSYCVELESLQANRIERLFRRTQGDLREQLRQYKSVKCIVDISQLRFLVLSLNSAGGAGFAQLQFAMSQSFAMKSGGVPQTVDTIVTMSASRPTQRDPWLIDRVIHRPRPKP